MADLNVTKMVIEVDLQCSKCYRKIKKVLCRYPEIRDQVYDKKKNTVTITVVSSCPEHIKQKIACKAGDTLKSIEILKPPAPAPVQDPAPVPKAPASTQAPKAPTLAPKPPPKVPEPAPIPPPALPGPVVMGFPRLSPPCPVPMYPMGVCCCCYVGGPCYHGRGPMCYDGCGQPSYECSGGNRGYYMSHCTEYFSEENASGCSVM